MYSKLLKEAQLNQELVAVYTKPEDTNSFALGQVLAIDEDFFILSCIDPNGNYDGCLLRKKDSIFLLEKNTPYIKKIAFLHSQTANKPEKMDTADFSAPLVPCLLAYAKGEK